MKKIISLLTIFYFSFFAPLLSAQDYVLRFGVMYFYPPFEATDSLGRSYGFDIAIAQSLCRELNKKCLFVPMSFQDLFIALDNNTVDAIISAITITDERKTKYDFTIPYYQGTMSFLAKSSQNIAINQAGLANKRIGVVKGSIFAEYLQKTYPQSKPLAYRNVDDGVDALSKNNVDLLLLDTLNAKWWANHSANVFKIVGGSQAVPGGGSFGIAVKKGNTALLTQLNAALESTITSGKHKEIEIIYLKFDDTGL